MVLPALFNPVCTLIIQDQGRTFSAWLKKLKILTLTLINTETFFYVLE